MHKHIRHLWSVPQRFITDETVYRNRDFHRRQFLAAMGGLTCAGLLSGCQQKPTQAELEATGAVPPPITTAGASVYPSSRNAKFEYGRPETRAEDSAVFTNFYEFTGPSTKRAYMYVGNFHPLPWSVTVDGQCNRPTTFDIDDLYRTFAFEERAYRHRCVETWAMCVPWTGFPLVNLIQHVGPKPAAKYVRFETFGRPTVDGGPGLGLVKPDQPLSAQAQVDAARMEVEVEFAVTTGQGDAPVTDSAGRKLIRPTFAPYLARDDSFPWPYSEGLTLAEATNELAFLATGLYGKPLPKQHGAPVRLVTPWKYGFKGAKSIVRITLTAERPATFWNTVAPREYDFEANVNPNIPHPRWSQRTEYMLGSGERFPTQIYNGYGEFVGGLYA